MIKLKRCNFFTGEPNPIASAVSSIVEVLELSGRNPLLITPPKSTGNNNTSTALIYKLNTQITFNGLSDFERLLSDRTNLFRVDLLIFDFYYIKDFYDYKIIIDKLDIDYIIIAKEYYYKSSDDINDFIVRKESIEIDMNNLYNYSIDDRILIIDKINDKTVRLSSLKKSYIRDKKIDSILKNKKDEN